ncbi:MAG: ABC transporter permease subunit [Chloroflexi bacterium]|nr:ABC transporter permease subunit [Chloroflexota bacterium]
MAQAVGVDTQFPTVSHAKTSSISWDWIGVVPFFLFAILFLLLPTAYLVIGGFFDGEINLNPGWLISHFTLKNFQELFTPSILDAYTISIRVSATTAIGGAFFGFLLAYAAILGGLPRGIRTALLTFSGVASNFAGVPLAFSFIATLGRLGLVTLLLQNVFGFNLYSTGFNILSFWGLSVTYMYFQFPLMVLIMAPALDGLKREWHEAAENLGASSLEYWRYIALPILLPTIIGTTLLLFANAFGAVATAYALTGSSLGIITILLYAQIRGDVLHNPNLGYAMAFGMIAITGISNGLYIWLRGRSERWLR